MAASTRFRTERLAVPPRGYKVRTVTHASGHQVRIAFPPGARRKGAGKVVSILHPNGEGAACRSKPALLNPYTLEGKTQEGWEELASEKDYGKFVGKLSEAVKSGRAVRFKRNAGSTYSYAVSKEASPDAAAYAEFHGRSPREVLEFQEPLVAAGTYSTLGRMYGLWMHPVAGDPGNWGAPEIEFEEDEKVLAVADAHEGAEQRLQIFFVGNGQKLPDEIFAPADLEHQHVELGICYGIGYITEKKFDGFKSRTYCHEFGEETGERPVLYYDRQAKRLLLVGGAYKVAPFDEALGASPGIVN